MLDDGVSEACGPVHFPAENDESESLRVLEMFEEEASMRKILVVDNDSFFLEFIRELLEGEGYRIKTAPDGLSALDVLEDFTPDFIFTDVVMPNIDGKRLCRILKRMTHLSHAKIIMVSSVVPENSAELKVCEADICISKGPVQKMAEDILAFLGGSWASPSPETAERAAPSSEKLRPRAITLELLSQNRHLELLLDRLSEAIFEVMPDGRIIYANSAAMRLTLMSEEELLGRHFQTLFSDRHRHPIENVFNRTDEGSERISEDPLPEIKGREVLVEVVPISGNAGKRLVILENVSEQRAAARALKKSEERYRLLFDHASDAIFILQDGFIRFPNHRTLNGLGCTAEELEQIPFQNFVHPEDRDMVRERHRRRINGEAVPDLTSFRGVTKTGEIFWAELNAVLIKWENRPATLNFLRDVTEKVKMEARLHQTRRMESVGRLAGGIAHDFNNLLMAIQGNASLLLLQKYPGDPDHARLKNIEQYVRKGAQLTRQLLGFARDGKYEPRVTRLNGLIKQACEMFGRTRKDIRIHQTLQSDLWPAVVDRGQMDQVFMNLYINASQAMPEGGDLMIETRNVTLKEDDFTAGGLSPGNYVKISVTDSGTGMDKETMGHVFDPFFTTRELGRGAGLGLASCYGIIKNHAGMIDVESRPGMGSTFTIFLPAVSEDDFEGSDPQEAPKRGRETVLLVEDEEMVLAVGRDMLKALGYKVLTAGSGHAALKVFRAESDAIDLVILDMGMPDKSGDDTFKELKKLNPDVKVLLSSGYSFDGRASAMLDRGCSGFIQKPFEVSTLSQKLRDILNAEKC